MGVYPHPFLSRIEPAVDAFVARIERARVVASSGETSDRVALLNQQGARRDDLP
jgi:hypothetical protein